MSRSSVPFLFASLLVLAGCSCEPEPTRCDACRTDGGDSDAGDVDAGCACEPDGGLDPMPQDCDDGNPCTIDAVAADGCSHDPVAVTTPCDDGDLCTLGDRCVGGACAGGTRTTSELASVGRLDAIAGRFAPFGDGRFVTVNTEDILRGRIQLVARNATGLEVVRAWDGDLSLVVLGPSEILVGAVPSTGLVTTGAKSSRSLRLFTVTDADIVPRGRVDELSGQLVSLAAHEDRLWLCTRDFLTGYRITLVDASDADAPVESGSLSLGSTACGSIAIAQDGSRVYVNTAAGVRFVDATPVDVGGEPVLTAVFSEPAGVAVSGDDLLLTTPSEVRVLDEATRIERTRVPILGARAATTFGDHLLVEGSRAEGGGTDIFASLYDLGTQGSPVRLADVVVGGHRGSPETGSYGSATDGTTLIASVGTRVFDLTHGTLDELAVPALVPLEGIARTNGGLRAYGWSAAAAIAVDDLAHPAFVSGGAFGTPWPVVRIGLDVSRPVPGFATGIGKTFAEDLGRVTLDATNSYYASPLALSRFRFDDDARLLADDPFPFVHQGRTQLVTKDGSVFALRLPVASRLDAHLLGYRIPAAGDDAPPEPTFDLPLTASTAARRGFDVDPRARTAVVSTEVAVDGGALAPALVFVDLASSPPTVVRTIPTTTLLLQVRIVGDRVVATDGDAFVFYDRATGEVSRIATGRWDLQLLAFDGTAAYAGMFHVAPGESAYELVAFRFGETVLGPTIEVDAMPKSLVPLDDGLAIGFASHLRTITPHCPAMP